MTGDFGDWDALLRSWGRSMRARDLAARTVELCSYAGRQLADYLAANGGPAEVRQLRREHVESFLADMAAAGRKASTVSLTYRALQQLMGFLVDEEELPESPMARMKPPLVPEQPVPVLDDIALRRLLAGCEGKDVVPGGTPRSSGCSSTPAAGEPRSGHLHRNQDGSTRCGQRQR